MLGQAVYRKALQVTHGCGVVAGCPPCIAQWPVNGSRRVSANKLEAFVGGPDGTEQGSET